MQFYDRHGLNVLSFKGDGGVAWVKLDRTDPTKTLFAADLDAESASQLFVALAKQRIDSVTDEDLDVILEFVREDPKVLAVDVDLLRAVMAQNKEAVRAFVETELGELEVRNLAYRRDQLGVMGRLLTDSDYFEEYRENRRTTLGLQQYGKERTWQDFFEVNKWIFGLGLDYRIGPAAFESGLEQVVKGADATSEGHRVDAVLRTRGAIGSLCMVEIKHHDTELCFFNRHYRSGVWQPSMELSGGIAQCHGAVHALVTNPSLKLPAVQKLIPKSILVVGSLQQFVDDEGKVEEEQFRSFELLRRQTVSPDIITFDELFSRAEALLIRQEAE